MGKKPIILTEIILKRVKYKGKSVRYFDQMGLYLDVGARTKKWRLKYRVEGKEKTFTFGSYPEISLSEARKSRDEFLNQAKLGVNLAKQREYELLEKQLEYQKQRTFRSVADEWLEDVHQHKVVPEHYSRNKRRLEMYVYPDLGDFPLSKITPPMLLNSLRKIERKNHIESAHRVKTLCGQVFRYGIILGVTERDMAADLRDALQKKPEKHHAALVEIKDVKKLIQDIRSYKGRETTRNGMLLSAYLFARPGEIRTLKWSDFEEDLSIWNFQPSKGGLPMKVKLPPTVTEILKSQKTNSRRAYVFTCPRNRDLPMSAGAINQALKRMGYKDVMTAHGFRAMARTILDEHLGVDVAVIEQQLAHSVRDALGRAYNRTTHYEARADMLERWSNFLNQL